MNVFGFEVLLLLCARRKFSLHQGELLFASAESLG